MWVHEKLGSPAPIDDLVMDRIGGASMEFLIVSAIAMINTSAVSSNIEPLMIIMIGGMTWNFICFFLIAPATLPDFQFERAIVELGKNLNSYSLANGIQLIQKCCTIPRSKLWNHSHWSTFTSHG